MKKSVSNVLLSSEYESRSLKLNEFSRLGQWSLQWLKQALCHVIVRTSRNYQDNKVLDEFSHASPRNHTSVFTRPLNNAVLGMVTMSWLFQLFDTRANRRQTFSSKSECICQNGKLKCRLNVSPKTCLPHCVSCLLIGPLQLVSIECLAYSGRHVRLRPTFSHVPRLGRLIVSSHYETLDPNIKIVKNFNIFS